MKFILLYLLSFSILSSATEQEFLFGVYTSDKPSDMVRKFKPILNELQKQLNTRLENPVFIKLRVLSSYEKGIDALINGDVDFARFGPASYILSQQQDPAIVLLAMESKKGKKTFNGIIAVKKDSPFQQLSDLKGKKFAFGDKNSTIGRYLAQSELLKAGIKASDLASFSYLGRHDKVGSMINIGQYSAGSLKESSFNKLLDKGANLRKLHVFTNVTKPWIARSGMKEQLIIALQQSLLAIPGFLPAKEQDYSIIKQSINENAGFYK